MESNEIQNLEQLKQLSNLYCRTLKSSDNKTKPNVAQINFLNYFELGCTISDLLKLCILALNHDANKISQTNKNAIDVSLILEMVLQMIPLDELEFLSHIKERLVVDSNNG